MSEISLAEAINTIVETALASCDGKAHLDTANDYLTAAIFSDRASVDFKLSVAAL